MIYSHETVRFEVARALLKESAGSLDAATERAAEVLALPVESVRLVLAVVPGQAAREVAK